MFAYFGDSGYRVGAAVLMPWGSAKWVVVERLAMFRFGH